MIQKKGFKTLRQKEEIPTDILKMCSHGAQYARRVEQEEITLRIY